MLVPTLNFLFTSSKIPLKYEYYNPKNNTRYSNPNEFINTNTTNFNDSTSSLVRILSKLPSYFFLKLLLSMNRIIDIIHPKLEWTENKWKEVGEMLGNKVWDSRKIVTERKSEIQLPASLNAYHASFPKFLTRFFNGLIGEIF